MVVVVMTMIMMAKIYIEKNMIANMKLQRRLIVCIKKSVRSTDTQWLRWVLQSKSLFAVPLPPSQQLYERSRLC